jgi:glucokinase
MTSMSNPSGVLAAVDWGGTWIRAAIVEGGRILHRERVSRPEPLTDQYAAIDAMVRRASAAVGATPSALGVGVAGVVQHGSVCTALNLGIHGLTDIAAPLAARTGLPTFIINDLQAAALGLSSRWPQGLTAAISMGTGVGGAVVDGGRLVTGVGGAGDFGHVVMDVDGPPCLCGGHGCLETLVSGKVLAAAAERLARAGHSDVLAARAAERPLHAGDLQDAADAGETAAGAALDRAAVVFAAGLRTVVAAVDPDRILLVGAMLAGESAFGRRLAREWKSRRAPWSETPLVPVADDEDAALLGAAEYAVARRRS